MIRIYYLLYVLPEKWSLNMGTYVVTGGTKGIGLKAAETLRGWGNRVINIDIAGGDINADLGTAEGREAAVAAVHERCGDGLDGLISNAGIAFGRKASDVLSVNYFGALAVCEGLYDLLKMKRGSCAVTVSGSIIYNERGRYYVDALLNNCGDEERICRLVNSIDPMKLGNAMYVSTKIALVRWVKRTAPSWAAKGVNLNAVGPGAVATSIMGFDQKPDENFDRFVMGLAMPTVYKQRRMMNPADVGGALALMVLPEAKGICGALVYCDAGTAGLLFSERYR
jgi:NAD(P)-dependent dehydrogenase (short-subunit alcohol dehydrogenase family)